MKRTIIILIAFNLLNTQSNIFALAPWQESREHLHQLIDGSEKKSFTDDRLAFIMPAKRDFDVGYAKQLFDKYPIAKALFTRAAAHYHLSETQFFELFDGISSRKALSENQATNQKVKEWGALISLYVVLYRVLDEEYNVSINPFGIMGNSLGIFAAFIAADALSLEEGLDLFQKFCEISLKAIGERTFYRMKIYGIPLTEVEYLAVSPGLVEVQHVHHRAHLGFVEEVTLVGEKQALEIAKSRIEEKHGSEKVGIVDTDKFAPFHTSILKDGGVDLEGYVSHIRIKPPTTKIFSSNPDKGVLETAEDIRDEILYTLTHPVRWDKMVEYASTKGIDKFIVLGRKGDTLRRVLQKGSTEVELIPVGDIGAIRDVKDRILQSLGVLEKFKTEADFFGFIYYLISNGAKRFIFDGFSGAGKSVLIESLAKHLREQGYNVVILHAGAFIRGGEIRLASYNI